MLVAKTSECDGALTVALIGDIDHHGAKAVREHIDEAISCYCPKTLILDFRDVDFIDSSAVGLIMGRYRILQHLGGEIKLTKLNPRCKRLLQMSGVASIISL